MNQSFSGLRFWFATIAFALLASCGGGGGGGSSTTAVVPPGTPPDTIVVGKVMAATSGATMAGFAPMAAGDPIEVTVVEAPAIKVMVGADGTFTLRGLPAGRFTLVFTQAGTVIGTLTFEQVAINQQITITVQVVNDEVVLVDEDRRGIGHAGIELEGLVQNVVTLNPDGDSTFVIAGREVIARPGVTAIRKGTTRMSVEDVKVGVRVHVKGTTIAGSTSILAYEIKIQETSTTQGTAEAKVTICHIPPGNPAKKHTISIGASAWPAHQAHGDTEGPC